MAKRITIKTNSDAVAYLVSTGADLSYLSGEGDDLFYIERVTCTRCGGAGYYPSQFHGACFECNGNPPNYTVKVGVIAIAKKTRKQELAAAARTRKNDAKNAAFNEKRDAKATEFDAAYPTLRADLADYLPLYCETEGYNVAPKTHRILNDMASKLAKWGDMSEGAVAFATKLLADEDAPKETIEEGKRVISGTVIKVDYRETQWGAGYKISVKLDDGSGIIWGSIPAKVEDAARVLFNDAHCAGDFEDVIKGAAITFSSTITRSDKSTDFGFFKRPTKPFALFAWTAPSYEVGGVTCEFCDSDRHASEDCPAEAHHCRMMER